MAAGLGTLLPAAHGRQDTTTDISGLRSSSHTRLDSTTSPKPNIGGDQQSLYESQNWEADATSR
jgi:hypothetical protein